MESNASPETEQRVLFHFHPSPKTSEGETYVYLLRNTIFNSKRGKALANQAIVAWWLPYARQAANQPQARETALDCIEQLEQHIAKLRRDFQIPAIPQPYQSLPVLAEPAVIRQTTQPTVEIIARDVVPDDALFGQYDMEE